MLLISDFDQHTMNTLHFLCMIFLWGENLDCLSEYCSNVQHMFLYKFFLCYWSFSKKIITNLGNNHITFVGGYFILFFFNFLSPHFIEKIRIVLIDAKY